MTTHLSDTHCCFASQHASPHNTGNSQTVITSESRFAALCARVFDSVKMKEVVGKADASNILQTIASISNNHGAR